MSVDPKYNPDGDLFRASMRAITLGRQRGAGDRPLRPLPMAADQ